MFSANRTRIDRRQSDREEVSYRTRANATGLGGISLQIVNISANGFMARTEAEMSIGQALSIRLPVLGEVKAEVRWSLGGRVGCQFARMVDLADYLDLLGALATDERRS